MRTEDLELALSKLQASATPEGRAGEREELRRVLAQVLPEEATALRPLLLALGSQQPQDWLQVARHRLEEAYLHHDPTALQEGLACLDQARRLAQRRAPTLGPPLEEEERWQIARNLTWVEQSEAVSSELVAELQRRLAWLASPPLESPSGREFRAPRFPENLLARAMREHLKQVAGPIREFLAAQAGEVQGQDWPEQDWDNYRYELHVEREWRVVVPLECLRYAVEGTVPLMAARRILGLPEEIPEPEEHVLWSSAKPPPGPCYNYHWKFNKRFLTLCAEIGGHFWEQGGREIVQEVLYRVPYLLFGDRTAVLLRCAVLGLVDLEVPKLAQDLLQAAALDELGARGALVLSFVDNVEDLPARRGKELLRAATEVARHTTALTASNPLAVCTEILAEADGAASVPYLVEVLERAAYIRRFGWPGWERALATAARSLERIVVQHGPEVLEETLRRLSCVENRWPEVRPCLLVAGARGLRARGDAAAEPTAKAALQAVQALPNLSWAAERYRLEALAVLAQAGRREGPEGLQQTLHRALTTGHSDRLLTECAFILAELSVRDEPSWLDEALTAAQAIGGATARWMALEACVEAALRQGNLHPAELIAALRRAGQRVWWRKYPLRPLMAWIERLTLSDDLPDPMLVAEVLRLTREVYRGDLYGSACARALMRLPRQATEVRTIAAFCDLALEFRGSWWSLAFLTLAGDSLGYVTQCLLRTALKQQRAEVESEGAVPLEEEGMVPVRIR